MKKMLIILMAALLMVSQVGMAKGFDASDEIVVVSREDGSGTRTAFIELFGVLQANEAGEKFDYTTDEALITNSTAVTMTTVAGNPSAIGYISLGSMNDTVKALKIDGAEASAQNVSDGSYKIARPFNVATKAEISEVAQDFIAYILSSEGQQIISDNGYIGANDAASYESKTMQGKIVVAGSSSVTPIMEKLKEAYIQLNADVIIEIQQSDSTTGMAAAIEGICDIGMASREVKGSEIEAGVIPTTIAMDGIAVIVNTECTFDEMTSEQIKDIFTGEIITWEDIQ